MTAHAHGSPLTIRRLFITVLIALLTMFVGYTLLEIVFRSSVAHAQGVGSAVASAVPVVDPTDPAADWQMIKTYGWLWGVVVVVAAGLMWFGRANAEHHWINANSRLLFALLGLGSVLTSVLMAKFDHAGWAGVIPTMFGALKLVLSPPKPVAT